MLDPRYVPKNLKLSNTFQSSMIEKESEFAVIYLMQATMQRSFQILGVDVMDLPNTEKENKRVVVFQDLLH